MHVEVKFFCPGWTPLQVPAHRTPIKFSCMVVGLYSNGVPPSTLACGPVRGQCHALFNGSAAQNAPEVRIAIGHGIVGQVAANGETVNIVDASGDDRFDVAVCPVHTHALTQATPRRRLTAVGYRTADGGGGVE